MSVNGLHILDSVGCMSVMLMCITQVPCRVCKCRIERFGFTVHYRYIRGRVTTCTTTFGDMRECVHHTPSHGPGPRATIQWSSASTPPKPEGGAEPNTEGGRWDWVRAASCGPGVTLEYAAGTHNKPLVGHEVRNMVGVCGPQDGHQ